MMIGQEKVYETLKGLGIGFEYFEHPEAPTVELAMQYCQNLDSTHCKNLFFRNHKGDRHYLVILHCTRSLAIRDLEQRLRQGKLSFASPQRMERYLGLRPGSVSPFGLVNDIPWRNFPSIRMTTALPFPSARRISSVSWTPPATPTSG